MTTDTSIYDTYQKASEYATNAQSKLTGFTDALNSSIFTAPTISATWQTVAPPEIPALGAVPAMPEISFLVPGGEPAGLNVAEPTLTIDEFAEVAPALNLGAAPTPTYGEAPTIPAISSVAVPAAPVVSMPSAPVYLSLNSVTFGGVDLHAAWLDKLDAIPELAIVSPTPYSYALGEKYASNLLDTLKASLLSRMSGGSGLDPAVEQAIWDRARDRETSVALANEQEVMRASEALGFALPTGVLAAQLREAQQNYYAKLSELSRDVAIKQADLEQANLKDTIAAGMQLESTLIDYSYKLESITFESAKEAASNALAAYNAALDKYKTLLAAYQSYASVYKTIIDSELAKVEVYKAELQGELAKAQINEALVQQYKASIEAGMSQVEIYKAQVGAAQTLVQLEQAKVGAASEQIRAYVAQVNAETSKVEAYKASVQAQTATVEAFKVKADAFSAKVGAQAEKAKAELGRYNALVQAKTAEWEGYKVKIQAEGERLRALGLQSSALLDSYKASAAASEAQANMNARQWESSVKQYEAGQQYALQAAKINGDFVVATRSAQLDASKVGAQVYAQLASSAYSMIHASTSSSYSRGKSVGYSYGGDVSGSVAAETNP